MSLDVKVDEDVCIGAANCVTAASEAFVLDDDGIARTTANTASLEDAALVAIARACPSGAIELFRGTDQIDAFATSL